ncbi:DUF1640 domain-containing protein [Methylomagnum sp.]
MASILLDTFDFAAKLKAGGFTEQQAEAQARAIAELVEKQLANKREIESHRADIQRDILESENRLEARLKELEYKIELLRGETKKDVAEIRRDMAEAKAELIRWVVGVGVLQFTLIAGLLLKLADKL